MTKPYSDADLSRLLAQDRTWRIKELSDFKATIKRADEPGRQVLLRALVCVCYAHWEGSVRFAARKFFEHVALRRLNYVELSRQYLRNLFLPKLAGLSRSKTSISDRCRLVDDILDAGNKRFSRANDELVNTQSNLSFEVISDICLVCGLDSKTFQERATFIDQFLLNRRNSIAHGEETFVDYEDLDELIDTTVLLMRTFGDELDNLATLKGYRAA